MKIDEGRLFHCVVVLGKKERRSELVKVRKGKKLSGWACLVFGYTGRRRTFVSTETSSRPRMMLNSVERLFQLFTWTSKRKSIDTAGESVLKSNKQRMADCTAGVLFSLISNISSGTAWLFQSEIVAKSTHV